SESQTLFCALRLSQDGPALRPLPFSVSGFPGELSTPRHGDHRRGREKSAISPRQPGKRGSDHPRSGGRLLPAVADRPGCCTLGKLPRPLPRCPGRLSAALGKKKNKKQEAELPWRGAARIKEAVYGRQ